MSTRMRITVGGKTYTVEVGDATVSPTTVVVDGVAKTVTWEETARPPTRADHIGPPARADAAVSPATIVAGRQAKTWETDSMQVAKPFFFMVHA